MLPDIITNGKRVRWLPAAEADALRAQDWNRSWGITTEHFKIKTNVPLSEAIAFGRRLEALHDLFFALCADVIGPELPLAQRFRSRRSWATTHTKGHQVWYFATKQEYVDFFQTTFRRDETISLGYYMPADPSHHIEGRSYFYRSDANPIGATQTLFHEASHQLLFESAGKTSYEKNRGNYWVWEGLGTYFETFLPQDDGSYQIGGLVGPRIARARQDVKQNFIPLQELVSLGPDQFRHEPEVFLHYPQSMAWVVFFMDYDHGRYRERFLEYVSDAYRGRLGPGRSLLDHLGIESKELEAEYLRFLGGR
jgi:hypothetical protein